MYIQGPHQHSKKEELLTNHISDRRAIENSNLTTKWAKYLNRYFFKNKSTQMTSKDIKCISLFPITSKKNKEVPLRASRNGFASIKTVFRNQETSISTKVEKFKLCILLLFFFFFKLKYLLSHTIYPDYSFPSLQASQFLLTFSPIQFYIFPAFHQKTEF